LGDGAGVAGGSKAASPWVRARSTRAIGPSSTGKPRGIRENLGKSEGHSTARSVASRVSGVSIDPSALESLNRDELIAKARELGAKRPELLTRPELRDEILRLTAIDDAERQRARGWFGVARDLVASVVSQGLNLSDTAELIRGSQMFAQKASPPVATVTLAEIYAAQGHVNKALDLLDQVLVKEPDHEAARQARERWAAAAGNGASSSPAATPVGEQAPSSAELPSIDSMPPVEQPRTESNQSEPPGGESRQGAEDSGEPGLAGAASGEWGPAVEDPDPALEPLPQREEACGIAVHGAAQSVPARPLNGPVTEDRILVVRHTAQSLLCAWQISGSTLERAKNRDSSGSLVLRIVEVEASWEGPITFDRSLELSGAVGQCTVTLAGAKTDVRVAIGWLAGQQFTVLGLATEFGWDGATGACLRWHPPATRNGELWESASCSAVASLMKSLENASA
jgi:hypothetical protein